MTRTRLISTTALASILGLAVPALAQAPMPAPMMAPAPVMAPAMAPAPETAVMPAAPVVAPAKPSDDMSGSIGFGVGVVGGTSTLIAPDTSNLMMKIWFNDAFALMPFVSLGFSKTKDQDALWHTTLGAMAEITFIKGASTRLSGRIGLGETNRKAAPVPPATSSDTYYGVVIPAGINVEHFFTRWFSMGLGAQFNLLRFDHPSSWTISTEVSNMNYMGSLFIYTD